MLLASAFGRSLSLFHPFRHFRFHRVEVEARAALHRWEVDEGLKFLGYDLLDQHKTPELELEPIEVLLSTFLRPIVGPALTLERIQAQVGDVGHIRMGLFAKPAVRLVDEAELVIVDAY